MRGTQSFLRVTLIAVLFTWSAAAFAAQDIAVVQAWDGQPVPSGSLVAFPATPAAAPLSRLFRIDNSGNAPLTLANPAGLVSGNGFALIETPAASVAPGGSTTFRVRLLSPSAGSYTGTVSIASNDPDESPYVIGLTGTVTAAPAPDIAVTHAWDGVAQPSGSGFTMPTVEVGVSDSRLFRITNSGNADLTLSNATTLVTGPAFSLIEVPAVTVAPGGTTTFRVRILSATAGTFSGAVSISSNDPDTSPYVIQLSGTVGQAPPHMTVKRAWDNVPIAHGGSFAFPTPVRTGIADSRLFTIENSGSENSGSSPLTLTSPAALVSGNCFSEIESPAATIPAGGQSTFRVRLLCATPGNVTGAVSIASNDGNGSSFVFALSGNVIANGASFVQQSIPSTMLAGRTYDVSVTMSNSGTTPWTSTGNYRLGIRPDSAATAWSLSRVNLAAGETVTPGAQKTFAFRLTAPATPGTYALHWQMTEEGVEWFGAGSPDVTVTVGAPSNDAVAVSQSVPVTMIAGKPYSASVTMRNSGNTTWTAADGYVLASVAAGNRFGTRVPLAPGEAIAPGQSKTFAWTVTAPASPGTFPFQWRMQKDPSTPFGAATPSASVSVRAVVLPVIDSITPDVIVSGQVATLVANGSNLAGATVEVSADGRALPKLTLLSVGPGQIRVTIDATNPAVDGYYGLVVHGVDGDTAFPFRVVPDRPVIDSWTPSQTAPGDTYLLVISGANLSGSTLRPGPGVTLYDVDTSDDEVITGLVVAEEGTASQLEIVGRNGTVEHIPIEIRQRKQIDKVLRTMSGKGASGDEVPGIYLEEASFPPRPKLTKDFSVDCHFHSERSRSWGRSFAFFRNGTTHQRDAGLLSNLHIGETRKIEALVVVTSGSLTLSLDLYCHEDAGTFTLRFDVCLEADVYTEIVGLGSQSLYSSACFGSDGPSFEAGGNGFYNFHFSVGGEGGQSGNCTRVTPTNGTENINGLPTADVETTGCCVEDVGINGSYYLRGDVAGPGRPITPTNVGRTKPGPGCYGDNYVVTVRAFIPVNWVSGLGSCRSADTNRGLIFRGDNRWYDPYPPPESWRIQQTINQVGIPSVTSGETMQFADDALVGDNRITTRDLDGVLGDCHLLHNRARANPKPTSPAKHILIAPGIHRFHMVGSASDPLILGAPNIDWDLTIELDTTSSPPFFAIYGKHDCYPGYEVYINDIRIYGYVNEDIMPGDATNDFSTIAVCLFGYEPIPVDGCQGPLGQTTPCGRGDH